MPPRGDPKFWGGLTAQAIESYWAGNTTADELEQTSKAVRKERWDAMKNAGVDIIPS